MRKLIALFIALSLAFSLTSCFEEHFVPKDDVEHQVDRPKKQEPKEVIEIKQADTQEQSVTYLAADLLKSLYNGQDNVLVSPISVSIALGLTAGGASGETYSQFESLLGRGMPMDDTVGYLQRLSEELDDSENVGVANSLWIRDDKDAISVKKTYLEYADERFDAEVYTEPFDNRTVKKINSWVNDETDGMIKNLIDKIDPENVMFIINALSFDAEWERIYFKEDTRDSFIFFNSEGEGEKATGMYSTERTYIEDENTTGFIKNYKGGKYSFALLLPREEVGIDEYVKGFSGEKLSNLLANTQNVKVRTVMPKFTFEYSTELNESLRAMGLTDAFDEDKADFSRLGTTKAENLFISSVIHKTFIEVAEKGTKAAAVTSVTMNMTTSAPIVPEEVKTVTADRPFVFAIIDNSSNLPMFIGTVLSVE